MNRTVLTAIADALGSGKKVYLLTGVKGFGEKLDGLPYQVFVVSHTRCTVGVVVSDLPVNPSLSLANEGKPLIIVNKDTPEAIEIAYQRAPEAATILSI